MSDDPLQLRGAVCPKAAALTIASRRSDVLTLSDSATLGGGHEDSNLIWAAAANALIKFLRIVHTGHEPSGLDMTLLEMLMPVCASSSSSSDDGSASAASHSVSVSASAAETFRKAVTALELHGDLSWIFGIPFAPTRLSSVTLADAFPNLERLELTDDGLQLMSEGRWSPRLPIDLLARLPRLAHLCIPTDTCAENLCAYRHSRMLMTLTVWDAVLDPRSIGRLSALTRVLRTPQLDGMGEAEAARQVTRPGATWAIIGRRISDDKPNCVDLVGYSPPDARAVLGMLDPEGMPGMTLVLELQAPSTPRMLRLAAARGSLQRVQILQLSRNAALPDARLIGECAEAARCARLDIDMARGRS